MASVRATCFHAASARGVRKITSPERSRMSEQGERVKVTSIGEVLETDEA